jgi:hypothetical protein
VSEEIRAFEREKNGKLVDSRNPKSIRKPEVYSESLQVVATSLLVLFRIVAIALLGAAAVAGPPE